VPELPNWYWLGILLMVALHCISLSSSKYLRILGVGILGFAYMAYHVSLLQSKELPQSLEGQLVKALGTISSVVEEGEVTKFKFLFDVSSMANNEAKWENPGRVQITWEKPPYPLEPGQDWQLFLKLKRPRGYANPGSFDSEKFYFQQRISAIGYVPVKAAAELIKQRPIKYCTTRIRQKLLNIILQNLGAREFIGVILALVLGLRSELSVQQWQVFQNTGTAHLMSVSGMHLGLIASLTFYVLKIVWTLLPVNRLRISALGLAAWGSIVVSSI
jgi:competence protein ComEC